MDQAKAGGAREDPERAELSGRATSDSAVTTAGEGRGSATAGHSGAPELAPRLQWQMVQSCLSWAVPLMCSTSWAPAKAVRANMAPANPSARYGLGRILCKSFNGSPLAVGVMRAAGNPNPLSDLMQGDCRKNSANQGLHLPHSPKSRISWSVTRNSRE